MAVVPGWKYATGVAGAIAIAILSLFVNIRQENAERVKLRQMTVISGKDKVSLSTRRFEGLRRILPSRGVVGYIGYGGQDTSGTEMYYLAQYALAPVIVDRSPDHPLVVVNFPVPVPPADRFVPPGYSIKADLGNGVLLLGKVAR